MNHRLFVAHRITNFIAQRIINFVTYRITVFVTYRITNFVWGQTIIHLKPHDV